MQQTPSDGVLGDGLHHQRHVSARVQLVKEDKHAPRASLQGRIGQIGALDGLLGLSFGCLARTNHKRVGLLGSLFLRTAGVASVGLVHLVVRSAHDGGQLLTSSDRHGPCRRWRRLRGLILRRVRRPIVRGEQLFGSVEDADNLGGLGAAVHVEHEQLCLQPFRKETDHKGLAAAALAREHHRHARSKPSMDGKHLENGVARQMELTAQDRVRTLA